jgi:hypothetical protein
LSFVKVENEQQKEPWCELLSNSYNRKIEKTDIEDPNFNFFLLYKDNVAVAASSTHKFEEEDRGLYFMSVHPEYENAGLLKIIAMETINYEKTHGCYFMVCQIEEKYRNIFEGLGFRKSHSI